MSLADSGGGARYRPGPVYPLVTTWGGKNVSLGVGNTCVEWGLDQEYSERLRFVLGAGGALLYLTHQTLIRAQERASRIKDGYNSLRSRGGRGHGIKLGEARHRALGLKPLRWTTGSKPTRQSELWHRWLTLALKGGKKWRREEKKRKNERYEG